MKQIDQKQRVELCRRLLAGDKKAHVDLASLYWDAGYTHLAETLLASTLSTAQAHARTLLGDDHADTRLLRR